MFLEAAFITTASEAIADQYATKYARRPLVINNTFPLPASAPVRIRDDRVLRGFAGQPDRLARGADWKTPCALPVWQTCAANSTCAGVLRRAIWPSCSRWHLLARRS